MFILSCMSCYGTFRVSQSDRRILIYDRGRTRSTDNSFFVEPRLEPIFRTAGAIASVST
jgi:hypothetical protein